MTIIGKSDGPTSVFIIKKNLKLTWKQKLEKCKYKIKRAYVERTIKAKGHSLDEVIDYMKKANLEDLRLIYSRSDREWQLQDEYNGKWLNEYTFFPGTLKGSDMAKECVLELLPMKALKELAERKNVVLPLYLYDHSGITMSCDLTYPYNDRWDSGQVGWIYASHQRVSRGGL